jgi:hypothetical protein
MASPNFLVLPVADDMTGARVSSTARVASPEASPTIERIWKWQTGTRSLLRCRNLWHQKDSNPSLVSPSGMTGQSICCFPPTLRFRTGPKMINMYFECIEAQTVGVIWLIQNDQHVLRVHRCLDDADHQSNSPPNSVFNPNRPMKDLNARSWAVRPSWSENDQHVLRVH